MEEGEEIIEEEEVSGGQSELTKRLRKKVKDAEVKAQEYLTGWQKERADSVNLRKRLEEEKREFAKYANENLILEILPALDSFDMAMAQKQEWNKLPEQWRKGMEYVHSQLLSALESQGVKRIYPLHADFNPSEHDALGTLAVADKSQDNKVVEVVQPGYSFNNKIIRTAKVKVGEYKNG